MKSPITSSHLAQISYSTPYSRTPSACILPLMWEAKFHTHIKQAQV